MALLAGIPEGVVNRAAFVMEKMSNNQPIPALSSRRSKTPTAELHEKYRTICHKFFEFDCAQGDVEAFLQAVWDLGEDDAS